VRVVYGADAQKGNSMNTVNIIGRLVRDPEVRRTEDGQVICNLRIAIDDAFSKEDRTDFLSVTVFGNQAEVCERYLKKGSLTGVSGRLRSDAYTDAEGVKRYPVKLIADRVQFLTWPEHSEKAKEEPVKGRAGKEATGAASLQPEKAIDVPDRADSR
jgi:single-strand DNA-binding protein